jgi:hypothetical protein
MKGVRRRFWSFLSSIRGATEKTESHHPPSTTSFSTKTHTQGHDNKEEEEIMPVSLPAFVLRALMRK